METIYLIILLIVIVICICCCACWCLNLQNTSNKNKVRPDIEAGHSINTEEVKPWAIKITDLDSSVFTTDFEPLLDSTDGRGKKEYDVALRAETEHGTLLWTNTEKVNKKMQMILISN